jgi:hypothetical protein
MAPAPARPPQPGEADGPSHRRGALLASAVLVVVGAAAYANSFSGGFFLDDYRTILDNHLVCDFWPRMRLLRSSRLIVKLSFVVNYAISGARPWSYHLLNLALHLTAALALFGVVRRTLLTERMRDRFGRAATPLALASAGLWMLHPLTTSAVTYVTQRFESAMGMFFLLTLYGAIRGATEQNRNWYVAAVAACLAGMASKETIGVAPVVVAGYDRIFLARSWREVLHRRWGLYLGLLAAWVVALPPLLAYGPLQGEAAPAAVAPGRPRRRPTPAPSSR